MNPFKNEFKIMLGSQEIILRPTFHNIASVENEVGGLGYLAWKFTNASNTNLEMKDRYKNLPSMSDISLIIYHCQIDKDVNNFGVKTFSKEEIWELVSLEGIRLINIVQGFIAIMASGNKEVIDTEKKS